MARLYADEHFPVAIVYVLRRLGHDVITVRETGLSKTGEGTPDELGGCRYITRRGSFLPLSNQTTEVTARRPIIADR